VWRLYRDAVGSAPGHFCVEEGIAYPDDLLERDPDGFRVLRAQAQTLHADVAPGFGAPGATRGLVFEPLSWWLEHRLYRYGYQHRNRCYVVGFNLPFDLGRVASHWAPARGYYRGGWSLGLWGSFDSRGGWHDTRFRPRLLMKAIDPRRTLFGWGSLKKGDQDEKGASARFIDLRTLAFALTDVSHTLESACTAFGDSYEKAAVDYDEITPALVQYAIDDVRHSGLLYRNTLAELARHQGIQLPPERLFSPATVGARYLEAMEMRRPLEKFTSLTDAQLGWDTRGKPRKPPAKAGVDAELLGYAMSAFYGGRAEARIVRTPVPVVYTDATSMYPLVNALLGTWRLLRAERLETEDVTEQVRELLRTPNLLDRCLTRGLWTQVGVTLVEIRPDGDILPVRATYQPNNEQNFGIGVNPLTYHGTLWYALPDVIATTLLGYDNPPIVIRAIRLNGVGVQAGLRPVKLRGGATLDPLAERDPFLVMIEERARVKADAALDEAERDRLELFLKITANATAYGSLARFDRRDLAAKTAVSVHGPDPPPHAARTETPEDPGPFNFPPVACSITAAARLMLAILERLVTDAGGTYAFLDTDSMGILACRDGGPVACATSDGDVVNALSYDTVREILDRFDDLNPYDPTLLRPWKIEHDSLDRQLWAYVISAKRYALYRGRADGTPVFVAARDRDDAPDDEAIDDAETLSDWSEHGLGLYVDPLPTTDGTPQRDAENRRLWMRQAWEAILTRAHGVTPRTPSWAGRYALTRFTVASPTLADWFRYEQDEQQEPTDVDHQADERVRPGSFGLLAHPNQLIHSHTPPALPAAPYEDKPDLWPTLPWFDRATGRSITITTAALRGQPDRFADQVSSGTIVVDTLDEVLARYTRRPEHKSLSPTSQPAGPTTAGLLQRRPVKSAPYRTRLTGKEGNKTIERLTGQEPDPAASRNDYGSRADEWTDLVQPALRDAGAGALIANGIPHSTAFTALNRPTPPRDRYETYLEVADAHVTAQLDKWGVSPGDDALGRLDQYAREREKRRENARRCDWCGQPLAAEARGDARYCSDRCRQAALRAQRRDVGFQSRERG
jgi:hypothetical protein